MNDDRKDMALWDEFCALERLAMYNLEERGTMVPCAIGNWLRHADVMTVADKAQNEINRLSKDVSELSKDAERYRFLRACDIPAGAGGAHCIIKGQFGMTVGDGEDLDMAIDNAMSARGKQEKV